MENDFDMKSCMFANDGISATLTAVADQQVTDLVLPSHVDGVPLRKVGFSALRGCDHLVSIALPDTVRHIEPSAFRDCQKLKRVTAGKGLQSIGQYAFSGCVNLRSMTVPSTLRKFGEKTFDGCINFTELIVLDMNRGDSAPKRFVIASHNENRRWSYINASLLYFDSYNMRKYDEGYGVLHGIDDLYNIAIYRLQNDEQLEDYMRQNYENMIRSSLPHVIRNDQIERLTEAGDLGLIRESWIDRYLEMASEVNGRCIAYLLNYKEHHFKKREMLFEL